jgi:flagellar biosynthesis protein FlhB
MARTTLPLLKASFVIFIDAILIAALILLSVLDMLVHGMLYDYGLVYSDAWAQPYWLLMRTTIVLIVIAVVILSVLEFVYPLLLKKSEKDETKKTRTNKKTA